MTNLERLEEAIENRNKKWELYLIAERERIAILFCQARGMIGYGAHGLPTEAYRHADQILRRG